MKTEKKSNYPLKFLLAAPLIIMPVLAQATPADTYFSLAVSDNSHNHYGENLLFLDFSDSPETCQKHPRTVCALKGSMGDIKVDGQGEDWQYSPVTRVNSRVMNNYPLGEHYDATPTELQVSARYDAQKIYFMVRYEDANHDASTDRNRWVYRQGEWRAMGHVKPRAGSPANQAVNSEEKLAGNEDEDQLFMMFPIIDSQKNYRDGGLGCGAYCHANIVRSQDPKIAQVGDGVASMHTAFPGDLADLWHWTATRTMPMQTLKDGYLDYGDQTYNGRKEDAGSHPFENNAKDSPFGPRYIHRGDYEAGYYGKNGHKTALIQDEDKLEITADMQFAEGVSIPFYVHKPSSGSLADVTTSASFDSQTKQWTIEIERTLETLDKKHDRQFVSGTDAKAPVEPMLQAGDPIKGKKLFEEKACAECHGKKGEGDYSDNRWNYPRNQRVSAPAIAKTVNINRPERLQHLVHELEKYEEGPVEAMMPYVTLNPQEIEDISSYLLKQYIHRNR